MTPLAARIQDAGISDSHEAIRDASCGDIPHTINPALVWYCDDVTSKSRFKNVS